MSTISSRFSTVATVVPARPSDETLQELGHRLSELYGLAQRSNYVFGSPLGPFYHEARHYHLPRFVYFGPHTHDESLRLAFLSGFDRGDLRSSFAFLQFLEQLILQPDLGQGLNLSFIPVVDALGVFGGVSGRQLHGEHWGRSRWPDIDLLQKDARVRGFHGFVRVETSLEDEVVSIRLRGHTDAGIAPSGVELISSEDIEPFAAKWEADSTGGRIEEGPLSIIDDLPIQPFELTLRIPASWSGDLYNQAISSILKRFIWRYRSLQAYGQYL